MEYVNLRDICKINMGQSPESTSYNSDKQGVPFYQGNADFGALYPNPRIWCSKPIKLAKENDILISVRAPVGALNFSKEECCIGRGLAAITLDSNDFLLEFIYWSLRTGVKELQSKSTGSTFKSINKKTLEEVRIPKISLKEQKDIIRNLTLLTNILAKYKHEIVFLDELVKARFVEMFGDPVHSEKYGTRKLSSCVAEKSDMVDGPFGSQVNTKVDYIENGEIPVIRTVNVKMMSFSPTDLKYMTREKYETVIRSQVLPGDVILTKVGTIGNVCIFPNAFDEAVLSTTGSCRIRVDNSVVNTQFFAYNLMYLKGKLLEIASAGVQPFLNMNHVKNIDILDVSLEKQKEFADFVKEVDKSRLRELLAIKHIKLLLKNL